MCKNGGTCGTYLYKYKIYSRINGVGKGFKVAHFGVGSAGQRIIQFIEAAHVALKAASITAPVKIKKNNQLNSISAGSATFLKNIYYTS